MKTNVVTSTEAPNTCGVAEIGDFRPKICPSAAIIRVDDSALAGAMLQCLQVMFDSRKFVYNVNLSTLSQKRIPPNYHR